MTRRMCIVVGAIFISCSSPTMSPENVATTGRPVSAQIPASHREIPPVFWTTTPAELREIATAMENGEFAGAHQVTAEVLFPDKHKVTLYITVP